MFALEMHGPDTFVGRGPKYPWGGLYGGQIVAQALAAASLTSTTDTSTTGDMSSIHPSPSDARLVPHSIRAYFIRRGDHDEPIHFDVDRIRNGWSFVTRRVVARQTVGVILNAECSFQINEKSSALQSLEMPDVPGPDQLENTSFSSHFDRRSIDPSEIRGPARDGAGRVVAWARVTDPIDPGAFADHCWLAYISDDLPADTVRSAHRSVWDGQDELHGTSLDHTIWFHRPHQAAEWHLYDFSCHHFIGARGLAIGHVFTTSGEHVATVAQEVLMREPRKPITTV